MKIHSKFHQPVKHHHALVAIAAAVLLCGSIVVASSRGQAATQDRYSFIVRGIVTAKDDGTLNVTLTHVAGTAVDDLRGKNQLFKTPTTKFYKVVSGKQTRITKNGVAVDQEVIMKGVSKLNGDFMATEVTVTDRAFTLVGRIKDVDRSAKIYTVEVVSSTYRSATYKGSRVLMSYGGNTTFVDNDGNSLNADDVKVGDQRIKVTGTVTGANKWEMTKVIDGYTKDK